VWRKVEGCSCRSRSWCRKGVHTSGAAKSSFLAALPYQLFGQSLSQLLSDVCEGGKAENIEMMYVLAMATSKVNQNMYL
jgi:hypothetical protein